MISLHIILCFSLIFCSFLVIFSKNAIESVAFMVLAFCNAASILILFKVEFLGITYVIVYVGAIAVLFLFVIMMLNTKVIASSDDSFLKYFRSITVFFYSFIYFIGLVFSLYFLRDFNMLYFKDFEANYYTWSFDNLSNIEVFGQILYNYFYVYVLLAGIILLVALVGAIVLTFRFNVVYTGQILDKQLSRSDNFISFGK